MFKTNEVLLKNLIEDVEKGKIQLPDFQRGWVWDDDRIKGLLASVSRGFPMGAVMTLSAGSEIKFRTRPIEGVAPESVGEADAFLLDGQQRLTSLYQSLRHPGPVDTQNNHKQRIRRWYYVDMHKALDLEVDREDAIISVPETRRETRDFGRQTVWDLSTQELEYRQHMMPSESLMNPMEWMLGYFGYWQRESPEWNAIEFFKKFETEVLSQFNDYQLPVINLEKNTPKEAVCTVFEKVNTGGVTLSVFELATASFAADAENFSLRDDWAGRRQRLYSNAGGMLQGVGGDSFLQAIALLKTLEERKSAIMEGASPGQAPAIGCRRRDILNLDLDDYQRWADRVEAGFIEAAKFLRSQYIFGRNNVPYFTQLVPLAALYVELGNELDPHNAKEKLEQWFWSGVFGEIYGGTTETQFALDLTQVASYVRGGPRPSVIEQANFIPERLLTLRTRNSAAYKGLYALQMKMGAKDWRTSENLSLAIYDNEHVDIHHIFPKSWCERAKPGIPAWLYNSVVNKTPIDAKTNRIIGGRAPSSYLGRLQQDIAPDLLDAVLTAHWLEPKHLREDDFPSFFVARGESMLSLIGNVMGRDLGSGRDVFLNALKSASLQSIGLAVDPAGSALIESIEDVEEEEFDELGEAAFIEEQRHAAD